MSQQEFSITFDLYRQIELTNNAELLEGFGSFTLLFDTAKQDKRNMRRFRKMLFIHDKAYGNAPTDNFNSI